MKKTTTLKKLILDKEILVMPGVYDALSAKVAEQTGFKAVVIGGYATSAARLGKPDINLLGLTEMVDHARYIASAVDIPLFADGDTGHGNVTNVARTIREFERAGVAGLFIEDQVTPKRCGHMEGKQVIPASEMTAKIKAATDARSDDDFVIMARTDALGIHGIDEAIERGNRYRQAGADMVFVEAPTTLEDLGKIARQVDGPSFASMVEGGKTPLVPAGLLQEMGFSVVAYGLSALYASAWAVRSVLRGLREQGTTGPFLETMIHFNEFNRLLGLEGIRSAEEKLYRDLLTPDASTGD